MRFKDGVFTAAAAEAHGLESVPGAAPDGSVHVMRIKDGSTVAHKVALMRNSSGAAPFFLL